MFMFTHILSSVKWLLFGWPIAIGAWMIFGPLQNMTNIYFGNHIFNGRTNYDNYNCWSRLVCPELHLYIKVKSEMSQSVISWKLSHLQKKKKTCWWFACCTMQSTVNSACSDKKNLVQMMVSLPPTSKMYQKIKINVTITTTTLMLYWSLTVLCVILM